jgi:hypothetical protein
MTLFAVVNVYCRFGGCYYNIFLNCIETEEEEEASKFLRNGGRYFPLDKKSYLVRIDTSMAQL